MARVPGWLRDGVGVLLGLIVAAVVIATVEDFGRSPRDPADTAPLLVALLGYVIGTLVGATIAARIARRGRWAAVAVAVVLALLATYNVASFAHPLWFLPVAIAIFVAAGWAGAQMTPRDRWPGRRVR